MNNVPPRARQFQRGGVHVRAGEGEEQAAGRRVMHGAGDGALADSGFADQMQRQLGGEGLAERTRRVGGYEGREQAGRVRAGASAGHGRGEPLSHAAAQLAGREAADRLAAPAGQRSFGGGVDPQYRYPGGEERLALAGRRPGSDDQVRRPPNARGGAVPQPGGLHVVVARQDDADGFTDCR